MNTTAKKLITDLAELRSAIRHAKTIIAAVRDDEGRYVCFVRLSKKEALHCAVESDKFDDYAAEIDGDYLHLDGERQPGLRQSRLPGRLAARNAAALARRAIYERLGLSVPDYLQKEIAAA